MISSSVPFAPPIINGDHRGNDRQEAGDHAAQPGAQAQVQKSFHHDLPGEGSGQRRGLAAGQKRDREQTAGHCGSQQRRQQLVRLLDLGDDHAALEKDGRRHNKDRGVHDQGSIERDHRIGQIVAAGFALFRDGPADAPSLNQRRMQVQIVRHHRRAENADGDIQALSVQPEAPGRTSFHAKRVWRMRVPRRNIRSSLRSASGSALRSTGSRSAKTTGPGSCPAP